MVKPINRIHDLLLEWDERRLGGEEVDAEDICRECPELLGPLQVRIARLKATDWIFHDDEKNCAEPSDPQLPESRCTTQQFLDELEKHQLLDAEEIARIKALEVKEQIRNTTELGQLLLDEKKLTRYQFDVLASDREGPLELGNYTILDVIDSGAMGVVYKALHRSMRRIVALKTLPHTSLETPEKAERFQREVQALAQLTHPNIVTAFDADRADDRHFLVMEYVEGRNLHELVQQQGPLAVHFAKDLILQAARGLDYVHRLGMVHRDVKPGNLLLSSKGTMKLLDMGLVQFEEAGVLGSACLNHSLTREGAIMGTAAYMAPEQALDTRYADRRSDIYSLGCTFCYLLLGAPPFQRDTLMKTLIAHRELSLPPLGKMRPDIPRLLEAVITRMTAKDPAMRYDSMADVIDSLERIHVEPRDAQRPRNLSWFTMETKRPPSRNFHRLAAAFVLLALAALVAIIIKLKTADGTLELVVNEPGAEVVVADEENRVELRRKTDGSVITISVEAGEHRLRVQKDGFDLYTQSFVIKAGNEKRIEAKLVPSAEEHPTKARQPFILSSYKLGPGDVLGVHIAAFMSNGPAQTGIEPLPSPDPDLPPSSGIPFVVMGDGKVHLPYIPPLKVEGLTVSGAQSAIVNAYTVEHGILKPDSWILVSLAQRRRPEMVEAVTNRKLKPGDVVTLYVQGITSEPDGFPQILVPRKGDLFVSVGVPLVINESGEIDLPYAGSTKIADMTLDEALKAVRGAYTKVIAKEDTWIMLSLLRATEVVADDAEDEFKRNEKLTTQLRKKQR